MKTIEVTDNDTNDSNGDVMM